MDQQKDGELDTEIDSCEDDIDIFNLGVPPPPPSSNDLEIDEIILPSEFSYFVTF